MSDFFFVLLISFFVGIGMVISVFYIKRETKKLIESQKEQIPLQLLKQDIENLRKKFENGYSKMAFQLGQVQEISRGLKEFQDFFRSPKLRGNIGEQILKDLLEQILPKKNFFLQYKFRDGQIVDAIIKTNQGLIPIDSKFPIENFRRMMKADNSQKDFFVKEFVREIKKHIDNIARKYILPQEGTVDFALMYLPSESLYYEITLHHQELLDYGYKKNIYFVSPNSFYYFLKIILLGLEGAKIEEGARRILEGMKAVQQEAIKLERELSLLFLHIDRTKTASEKARNRFEKLVLRIEKLGELEEPKEKKPLEIPAKIFNNQENL